MAGSAGAAATHVRPDRRGQHKRSVSIKEVKEQAMPTMIMTEEQNRDALATRMRGAILSGLIPKNDRAEEELFKGMDQRMVLGAIADLAESLIVYVGWAS